LGVQKGEGEGAEHQGGVQGVDLHRG
jgi:hypothetical protein